jgi:hypothetical protein
VDRNGGFRVLKADFLRSSADESLIGHDAWTWLDVSQEQVPLKRDDKELFARRKRNGLWCGETVCCLIWPDKLPTGADFVASSYMPETVDTYRMRLALQLVRARSSPYSGALAPERSA